MLFCTEKKDKSDSDMYSFKLDAKNFQHTTPIFNL